MKAFYYGLILQLIECNDYSVFFLFKWQFNMLLQGKYVFDFTIDDCLQTR